MVTASETITSRSAGAVLVGSRRLFWPALRAAVDSLPASMRCVAGYHFGWLDEQGRPTGADGGGGGKAIRPALVLLAADAVGGEVASAVPAAVTVELVHNFSLLHDDVLDGDVTRRHRPTAWRVFGRSAAILAGDALLTLAFDVLAATGSSATQQGLRRLATAVVGLVDGQSADVAFEGRADVGLAECTAMTKGKTGGLLGCAAALGALFAGGSAEQVERLHAFGEDLGVAFQHVDDLLGIWGDPAATGKSVYSDLRSRKKSLPVVAALNSDTAAGRELQRLYHRDRPPSSTDPARLAELVERAGGRTWSRTQADDLLARALRHLRSADPAQRAEAELAALARLVVQRDH